MGGKKNGLKSVLSAQKKLALILNVRNVHAFFFTYKNCDFGFIVHNPDIFLSNRPLLIFIYKKSATMLIPVLADI